MSAGTVTRAEWRWVLPAAFVVLAVAQAPFLYAWARSGPQAVFSGSVLNIYDGNSYLAKMQQGAHGDWLFHIAYTTEPHAGSLVFLPYLLLGQLAAAAGLAPVAALHLAWWAGGLLMLAVTYAFVARFLRALWMRRLAWTCLAACSGLSWIPLALGGEQWLRGEPPDVYLPEGFASLMLIYRLPHLALARACLLGGLLVMWSAFERGSVRRAAGAGLLWLVAVVAVPLYAPITAALMGAYLIALAVRRRALPLREAGLALVAGACLAPYTLYVTWMFRADTVLAAWTSQQNLYSPPPLYFLASYGLLAALAVPAVAWAGRGERRVWLLACVAVAPVLISLPVNFQRRLLEGFQVALVVLAVAGLAHIGASLWRRRPRVRRLARLGLIGALLPMNLLLLIAAFGAASLHGPPVYNPGGLVAAGAWLEQHAQRAHVLCSLDSGNVLPALAYVRVYLGHDPETPHVADKQRAVARFYQAGTPDAERRALLVEGRIDYVMLGDYERALAPGGAFDAAGAPYLREVFRAGEWLLYEVIP